MGGGKPEGKGKRVRGKRRRREIPRGTSSQFGLKGRRQKEEKRGGAEKNLIGNQKRGCCFGD